MTRKIARYLKRKLKPAFQDQVKSSPNIKPSLPLQTGVKETSHTAQDLFSISETMFKHGYKKNAGICIDLIPENKRANKHNQLLSSILLAQGDYSGAENALDNINKDTLSSNGQMIFLQTLAKVKAEKGDTQGAIREYQILQSTFRENILKYAVEILKLHHSSGDKSAFESYLKFIMAGYPNHTTVVEMYCAQLYDTNQLDKLQLALDYYLPRFGKSEKLCVLAATCAWIDGDIPRFDHVMRIIRANQTYTRVVGEQLQRWRAHISSAEETAQAMSVELKNKLDVANNATLIAHAWALFSIGESDIAIGILNRYINNEGPLLQAYLLRGLIHHDQGNSHQSQADLEKVIDQEPRQNLAYRALLQTAFQKYPDMGAARKLITRRNAFNRQFTASGTDGRIGFYDVEGGQARWFEGNYLDGYRAKLHKATYRYLEASFPHQYRSFSDLEIHDSDRRILVLADDGISDEIRWASVYADLPEDREILVTCEPRLLSLFRRSFPQLSFTPVARRWPDLPKPRLSDRSQIDNVDFARIITDEIFGQIKDFDRLLFQQDLVAAHWGRQPGAAPSSEGAGEGAFLVPDPKAVAMWRDRLQKNSSEPGKRLKVGLNWRSGLINARRQKQYLSLSDVQEILKIENIDFYALQHGMTQEEQVLCAESGVIMLENVDWQDDFETIAAVCANMDLVVGISSSSFEVAAAVGVECWLAGISPEAVGLRLGGSSKDRDRISWNTRVIQPKSSANGGPPCAWPRQAALDRLQVELARKAQEFYVAET